MGDSVLFEVRAETEGTISDLNIPPFKRQVQEVGYFALYEISKGNKISRRLRHKCNKYDFSKYTRKEQEIRQCRTD
jgi:hypothetical protein